MAQHFFSTHARRRFLSLAAASTALSALGTNASFAVTPLKIATIGSGKVGTALGTVWAKAGHPVMFSSRHPESLKDVVAGAGPNAKAGTVAEAVAFADVVVLAVPYGALPDLAKEFAPALAKKVLVIDTCNPFTNRDGDVAVAALEKGAGLYTAQLFPGMKIVRSFNAIPAAKFLKGGVRDDGARVGMPMAGDDAKAIEVATGLVREVGYEPMLVGNLDFGKHLITRVPLAGEHTPDEVRAIAAGLK